jgi:hypothetical protein
MTNLYRVDRVTNARAPLGMNSIRYIGDSWSVARRLFEHAATGLDAWDQPNAAYGVVLSVWDANKNEYVVKCSKGL